LDTLSTLESLFVAGFVLASIVLALVSAQRGIAASKAKASTGELVWSLVAVVVLAGVSFAVRSGIGHGS
jgi:hypothetical protein